MQNQILEKFLCDAFDLRTTSLKSIFATKNVQLYYYNRYKYLPNSNTTRLSSVFIYLLMHVTVFTLETKALNNWEQQLN